MKFQDKLKIYESHELWQEYCGFLDLSIDDFMEIQNRLMLEQLELWCCSPIGKKILGGSCPQNIEEFRNQVPLTTYDDYADMLLLKDKNKLPADPVLWIQTTWEGGMHAVKLAPYTRSMLQAYKRNIVACLMLSTSTGRNNFNVDPNYTILYGLAPLPYATGILPLLLNDEINIEFLPPVKEAESLSFSERNKKGFKLGMKKGIDYFFGVGSVTYFVSLSLSSLSFGGKIRSSSESNSLPSLSTIIRYLKGVRAAKRENRELMPKDLFKLKGFMCAGTDNRCYKDDLEHLWGIRPMEVFAGTEPTCIGTEIWSRDGLYFFPDACFYEFIHETEMEKNRVDPTYNPKTCLLNQVVPGEKYEIVISVLKGGAFARYRVGDMYRCIGLKSKQDEINLPRFEYIDRVPTVIDIAGFTRITEDSITQILSLAALPVQGWFAAKEFSENNKPFLHLYLELSPHSLVSHVTTKEVIREHLSVYFKYFDTDYQSLKKILGMEPLEITILPCGTLNRYLKTNPEGVRAINPSPHTIREVLSIMNEPYNKYREGVF